MTIPDSPFSREETYLANIAGENVEKPATPYSRKEAYLDAISGRVSGIDQDVKTLETTVAALATDFSYKGSVENYASLPESPAVGDVYTTSDDGKMYVWDGTAWQVLNMAGGGSDEGELIRLTTADYNYPADNPDGVAAWTLPDGTYSMDYVRVYFGKGADGTTTQLSMISVGRDTFAYNGGACFTINRVEPKGRSTGGGTDSWTRDSTGWKFNRRLSVGYRICLGVAGSYQVDEYGSDMISTTGEMFLGARYTYTSETTGDGVIPEDAPEALTIDMAPTLFGPRDTTITSYAGAPLSVEDLLAHFARNKVFAYAVSGAAGAAGLVPAPSGTQVNTFLNSTTGWTAFPQADYDQSESTQNDYIKNKPFYTEIESSSTTLADNVSQAGQEWDVSNTSWFNVPDVSAWLNALSLAHKHVTFWQKTSLGAIDSYLSSGAPITFELSGWTESMDPEFNPPVHYQLRATLTFEEQSDSGTGMSYWRASGAAEGTFNNWTSKFSFPIAALIDDGNIFPGYGGTTLSIVALDDSVNVQWWYLSVKIVTNTEIVHQLDSKYIKLDPAFFEIDSQGRITLK